MAGRRKNLPRNYQCQTCMEWFRPQGIGVHQARMGHKGRNIVTTTVARARERDEATVAYEQARAEIVTEKVTLPVEVNGVPPVERPKARVSHMSIRVLGILVEDEDGKRYILEEFDDA